MTKENDKFKRKYDEYITFGVIKSNIELPTPDAKQGIISYYEDIKDDLNNYLDVIFKEEYFYSKNKIAEIFDLNTSFVQKFMVKDFKALFITKDVKNAIKTIDNIFSEDIELDTNEDFNIYDSTVKFIKKVPDYKAVLLYKKSDIINWILKSSFKKEIIITNDAGVLQTVKVDIDNKDIELIFKKGLKTNKSIGKLKELDHSMQISRHIKAELSAKRYIKYTFLNKNNDNNIKKELIRYMIMN